MSNNNYILIIVLNLFCAIKNSKSTTSIEPNNSNNSPKSIFSNLLKSIVNINVERIDALKKLYKLQSNVPRHHLRSANYRDQYESYERKPHVLIVFVTLNNENISKMNTYSNLHSGSSRSQPKIENILQGRVASTCGKRAAKTCKKAYRNAYDDLCEGYKCISTAKNAAERQCNRGCNDRFLVEAENSDSSDEEDQGNFLIYFNI